MKTIDNYILERLNPRHLGSTNRFPIDGTIKDMIRFLEDNEFTEFGPGSSKVVKRINDQGKRGYMTDGANKMLWIADTSKDPVSEDNPVFWCFPPKYFSWIDDSDNNHGYAKQEFLKKLNEVFGI
jgi:hypothetical protein